MGQRLGLWLVLSWPGQLTFHHTGGASFWLTWRSSLKAREVSRNGSVELCLQNEKPLRRDLAMPGGAHNIQFIHHLNYTFFSSNAA